MIRYWTVLMRHHRRQEAETAQKGALCWTGRVSMQGKNVTGRKRHSLVDTLGLS